MSWHLVDEKIDGVVKCIEYEQFQLNSIYFFGIDFVSFFVVGYPKLGDNWEMNKKITQQNAVCRGYMNIDRPHQIIGNKLFYRNGNSFIKVNMCIAQNF